jgi:uncharacterized membrane protein YgcG
VIPSPGGLGACTVCMRCATAVYCHGTSPSIWSNTPCFLLLCWRPQGGIVQRLQRLASVCALTSPYLCVCGSRLLCWCPQGSVVQRLQRFATYSHLKQVVLRMITEEMRSKGKAPSFGAALQVRVCFLGGGSSGGGCARG